MDRASVCHSATGKRGAATAWLGKFVPRNPFFTNTDNTPAYVFTPKPDLAGYLSKLRSSYGIAGRKSAVILIVPYFGLAIAVVLGVTRDRQPLGC
jgi:hypothetical protein